MKLHRLTEINRSTLSLAFLASIAVFSLAWERLLPTSPSDLRGQIAPAGRTYSDFLPVSFIPNTGPVSPDIGFLAPSTGTSRPSRQLEINPSLDFSTYLGGTINEHANAVVFDPEGNMVIVGYTESVDFPTTPDAFQPTSNGGTCFSPPPFMIPFPCNEGFLTKISADGSTILYSTYLGGTGDDGLLAVAIDDFGDIYLTGWTTSLDFPTVNPIQPGNGGGGNRTPDAFVAKLSSDGSTLRFSTYLGGGGRDYGDNLAIDSTGSVYVTGWTESTDFPTFNAVEPDYLGGFFDGFVAKINPEGTALVYSTYIGGRDLDYTYGIDADDTGHAYLTGFTLSDDLSTVNAYQPAFGGGIEAYVAKLLPDGSGYVFNTYFGSDDTRAYDVRVNDAGSIYLVGITSSPTFPLVNPLQDTLSGGMYDAMAARFLPDGSDLDFSTYLGGSDHEVFHTLALDEDDNLYFAGWGNSPDFPLVDPLQVVQTGTVDALFGRISADLTILEFSTFFGGTGGEYARAIAVDSDGNITVAGPTSSVDLPLQKPLQPSLLGETDGFLLLVEPGEPVAPQAGFFSSSPDPLGETTVFTNTSTGTSVSFQWDFGDGSAIVTDTHPTHLYGAVGVYTVTLTASNNVGSDTDVGTVQIEVQQYELYVPIISVSIPLPHKILVK